MKYLKMFGLAAITAAAVMAFAGAGTASATVLCSTTTNPCNSVLPVNTVLDFSLEPGTSLVWQNGGNTLETCSGVTLRSHVTSAGGPSSTVKAKNTTLDWSSCTWSNKTTALGGLEIHNISGTHNGTLTASEEIKWEFTSGSLGTCIYGWKAGSDIGTITEGKPATLDMNTTIVKFPGSSVLCPENGTLLGSFIQTEPANTTLAVEPS
jgi:hypothetical protein